jgi:pimeloyl-ACP methyl ester carboxylesterase
MGDTANQPAPAGRWRDERVAGRLCQIYEPPAPSPHGAAVLYLHDQRGEPLAAHPAFAALFDRYGLRCAAPAAGPSWWTDRRWEGFDAATSPEEFVLEDVLPWIEHAWPAVTKPALLGVGMGGQGALKLAYKHPNQFPVVAAIAPAIDYQRRLEAGDPALQRMYRDAEQARQDTATLHIHPLNWPRHQWFAADPTDHEWFESADRLRMKLYSLGVPYECDLETVAGGHDWRYFEHMAEPAVRFIAERLERERLRVV